MFDSFGPAFSGARQGRFAEGDSASADEVTTGGGSSFGAIASYQVCACCARFHGPLEAEGGGPVNYLNGDDRGGAGPNTKPSLSNFDAGAQITRNNTSWATNFGTAANVTFAFRDTFTSTLPEGTTGHTAFNATQIAITLLALSSWSDVANITFTRVQDGGTEFSESATILFGNYATGQEGAAAFAYLPGNMPGNTNAGSVQGDVWINSSQTANNNLGIGGYGVLTLVHEIGHAIGLSHPGSYNASAGGSITYSASAVYYEDSLQYTVMSYFSERETGGDFRQSGAGTRTYASAPLMDDIAAAQRLYGANTTTRTGDTTYGFNSNAGQPWYLALNASSRLVFSVWDAGGIDTLDFSEYDVNQTIDLRQGAFSNVGGMVGNVSIAVGAVIENAIGGLGADVIRGNSGDNVITGNGGGDVIDGGLGSDTVVFARPRGDYTITWNGQTGTVSASGEATVIVTNVEFLRFSDQTIAATPSGALVVAGDITNETINGSALNDTIGGLGGNDIINGLDGADGLDGGSGNDTVNGGEGNDTLLGGLGDDILNGGAGIDTADYFNAGGAVLLSLAAGTATGLSGTDTLVDIENVRGSAFNDSITGDASANVIRGGGGVDTLSGGGGADELVAGAPGNTGGAPDVIKGQSTVNATIATAVSLDGTFDRVERAGVEDNTVPHTTVVATASGQLEYYAFTVAAGDVVRFDIDAASFDSALRLFDGAGNELAQNDDQPTGSSDGSGGTDSLITYTFATAGTYYIQVSQWSASGTPVGGFASTPAPVGGRYQLNVSIPSQPVAADVFTGSTLNGDAGDDILMGLNGRDTLNGGADNDTINGGGDNDTIDGGTGTDTAVFSGNRSTYTISAAGGTTTITGQDGTDTLVNVERLQFADGFYDIQGAPIQGGGPINGTPGSDVLNGTSGADTINGLDGDDTINGGAGNDTIDGGTGLDTAIFSGTIAASTVTTAAPTTTVTGPDGTDTLTQVERLQFSDGTLIVGAGGGQYFAGTANADTTTGTAFADQFEAGGGDDVITGAAGNDSIDGGTGTDRAVYSGNRSAYTITINAGVTTIMGPDGIDTLSNVERLQFADGLYDIQGAPILNNINGTTGPDVLNGTTGADNIVADAGDDIINGLAGNDTIDGGAGIDTAVFSGTIASSTVSTTGGTTTVTGPDGTDTLTNVERLQFSNGTLIVGAGGGQYFAGTANADTTTGTGFADQFESGAGDDVITGAAGNDTIDGGTGTDRAVFSANRSLYTISTTSGVTTVTGPDGTDSLTNVERLQFADGLYDIQGAPVLNPINGTTGADVLNGTAGADSISADAGDDVITGAGGNDSIDGGAGTDTAVFSGTIAGSTISTNGSVTTVTGPDGTDTLTNVERLRFSDGTLILGAGGGQYFAGTANADTINGTAFNDQIEAGSGDDTITGGAGADSIDGGAGTDTAVYASTPTAYTLTTSGAVTTVSGPDGADTLTNVERVRIGTTEVALGGFTGVTVIGGSNAETLTGAALNDRILGGAGGDTVQGLAGDDTLGGGAGNDVLQGGDGIDTADYSLAAAGVTARIDLGTASNDGDGGSDTLSGIENLTGSDFNDLLFGNGGANALSGGLGRDVILGLGGNDTISGGAGVANELYGGLGDDTYIVEVRADTIVENAGEGIDTVLTGIAQLNMSANVENLTYTGTSTFVGVGNAIGNTIRGGTQRDALLGLGGNDILIGGSGAANELYGGLGDDYYIIEAPDSVIENAAEGTDTVEARIASYTIGANVENLVFGGTGNFTGNGNALANTLIGGAGNDVLAGRGGNDSLVGGAGIDTASYALATSAVTARLDLGTASNDGEGGADTLSGIENLVGSGFNDLLFGNAGANDLSGGLGRDVILGLAGDDIIRGGSGVANELYGGLGDDTYVIEVRSDTVVENAGEGIDTVLTGIAQLNMSANVENLTYTGTSTFVGVGNAIGNTIRGGTQRDALLGLGGNDILIGGSGAANELYGGLGDDYYILEAADSVIESAGEGIDTVEARIASYTIGANVENLMFGGTGNFTGNGNALDNVISGGAGNDVLRGGGGSDTINGGAGTDTVVLQGVASGYTITAEGAGWRIIDGTVGRDGSILVNSVETVRFGDGSTQTLGASPIPESIEKPTAPQVLVQEADGIFRPLAVDDEPPILTGLLDDAFLIKFEDDRPLVLPGSDEDRLDSVMAGGALVETPADLAVIRHPGHADTLDGGFSSLSRDGWLHGVIPEPRDDWS